MGKGNTRRVLRTLLSLGLCAAVLAGLPLLKSGGGRQPGQAQRTLLTAWIYGDGLNASPWIRRQAAAYQQGHPGVSIWVRTVSQADMQLLEEDFEHTAPDLIFFMGGEGADSAQVTQVQPVCRAGYALVMPAQETVTKAPASLFGITPTPQAKTEETPVPREEWPRNLAADDALGAYFLLEMGAPAGAQLLPGEALKEAFVQRRVEAALLSTVEIGKIHAQGTGTVLLCAAPGSDLVLYGAVMQGAQAAAAEAFAHFLSPEAQRALKDSGLFSVRQTGLYGGDAPVWQAVEAALQTGWLPDAFAFQREKEEKIHAGQLLYGAK